MTSWSEEFLGVSFQRPAPTPLRPRLENSDQDERCEPCDVGDEDDAKRGATTVVVAPRRPLTKSFTSGFGLHQRGMAQRSSSEVLHQLDQLPAAVALAATAALQPQLDELRRRTSLTTGEEATADVMGASRNVGSPIAPDAHAAAAAVVQELVPRLAAPLSLAFKDALAPQMESIVRQAVSAGILENGKLDEGASVQQEQLTQQFPPPPTHTESHAPQKLRRSHTPAQHKMPKKAFVVNFRRLIAAQKGFYVIHEFVKATAIAALTLVGAGNAHQLLFSAFFVCFILVLFGMHESKYDTTDISDFNQLSQLVEDDHGICGAQVVENPNRILKALTLTTGKARRRLRSVLSCIIFLFIVGAIWTGIFWIWQYQDEEQLTGIALIFYGQIDTEDQEMRATLLLVASLLLALHILFEWLYWRETQCVMPSKLEGKPWDPRLHGVPASHRWLGLPSMWFTSEETYNDMRLWITLATTRQHNLVLKIFPEEMALYALDARNAGGLHRTLAQSKLYDVQSGEFLTRKGGDGVELRTLTEGEVPEELGVDLVFYDNLTNEYLQVEDSYVDGLMHVLQRGKTGWALTQSNRGFKPPTPSHKVEISPHHSEAPLPPSLLRSSLRSQASKPLEEMVNDAWLKESISATDSKAGVNQKMKNASPSEFLKTIHHVEII